MVGLIKSSEPLLQAFVKIKAFCALLATADFKHMTLYSLCGQAEHLSGKRDLKDLKPNPPTP